MQIWACGLTCVINFVIVNYSESVLAASLKFFVFLTEANLVFIFPKITSQLFNFFLLFYRHPIFGHPIVGSRKTPIMVSVDLYSHSVRPLALYG